MLRRTSSGFRYYFTACLAILFFFGVNTRSTPASAQAGSRLFPEASDDRYVDERIFFGALAAGAGISQVDGDTKSGYHKIGINAGATVYARLSRIIAASLELRFAQKGSVSKAFTANAGGVAALEVYKIKLNYAEVPLMLHYLSPGRITYSAGLAYAYLISSRETYEAGYPVNLQDRYPFVPSEISGLIGGNYVVAKHWSIEARGQYSIGSIRKPENIPVGLNTGSGGQRNNVITIRVMYVF